MHGSIIEICSKCRLGDHVTHDWFSMSQGDLKLHFHHIIRRNSEAYWKQRQVLCSSCHRYPWGPDLESFSEAMGSISHNKKLYASVPHSLSKISTQSSPYLEGSFWVLGAPASSEACPAHRLKPTSYLSSTISYYLFSQEPLAPFPNPCLVHSSVFLRRPSVPWEKVFARHFKTPVNHCHMKGSSHRCLVNKWLKNYNQ